MDKAASEMTAKAWTGSYAVHSSWLRSILALRYGAELADDLIQEIWLRLASYDLSAIRHPKALMLRIASNLAVDRARQGARGRRYAAEVMALDGWGREAPTQLDAVMASQLVLGLPQPLRDVFLLSRAGGLTNSSVRPGMWSRS